MMRRWIMTTNSDTAAIKNIFDVSGKVALITGATGSLGHALTCGLAMMKRNSKRLLKI
jgi:FlaA1/EpsC-like NDP-sugar epimerase